MEAIKVSIIVPVYNSEKYLNECIDSILIQSYSNFDVYLINDGSTDRSGRICEDYALKDPRVRVFHKDNEGVSSARNLGIEKASGAWITFVDSDDTVEENFIRNFLKDDIRNSDFIIHGFLNFCNNEITGAISKDSLLNEIRLYPLGPVSKLYSLKIIERNKLKFDNRLHYGEDTLFNIKYLAFCENILIHTINDYFYRKTEEVSLSKKTYDFDENYYFVKVFDHELKKLLGRGKEDIRLKILAVPLSKLLRSLYIDRKYSKKERKYLLAEILTKYYSAYKLAFAAKGFVGVVFNYFLKIKKFNVINMIYGILLQIKK